MLHEIPKSRRNTAAVKDFGNLFLEIYCVNQNTSICL